MKFQTKEYHTNQSSNVAGQSFQVSMTAKFFETLFSGLYRYKEAAVIRELFCNAIDSHKMRDLMYSYMPQHYVSVHAMQRHNVGEFISSQDTRVEIHLPDDLEPWLEIKDYGIGLSLEKIMGEAIPAHEGEVLIEGNIIVQHDEVPEGKGVIGEPGWYNGVLVFRSPDNNEIIRSAGLYTTLFDSTKADSNDQIGAFGLGSKSPFAISDSFTVETRYNGELHNFVMFLNDKRIPTCELATKDLDTRDPLPILTDEKNGMTVRVPVKTSSYQAFADQLSDLCRVLLPEEYPVVTNDDYFDGFTPINREQKIFDTYVQQVERSSHASTHYAVMGGVAYPIELDQLDEQSATLLERFPSTYTFFPLGALNVPPSREDLSYDQFTKASLNEKMNELRQGIMEKSLDDIRLAALKGPLWLHMEKQKYSEMYGSGFKKMMDLEFPADPRFYDKNLVVPHFSTQLDVNSVHVKEANYDYMLGVGNGRKNLVMISKYDRFSKTDDSQFTISETARAAREGRRPLIVVLDNMRCYAQKIKQYFSNDPTIDQIWVISPTAGLVSWRNMDLEKHYVNHKEIKDEITKWVGDGKTIDYLRFADQFTEYYDGLVNPVVKFMSELPYEMFKIVGDIGMLQFSRSRRTGRYGNGEMKIEGQSFRTEDILKVAETGQKMIYVEFSGHDMIHKDMTQRTAISFQDVLFNLFVSCPKTVDENGYMPLVEKMGWYNRLCIVRKKAIPFLKENSDFFIDINDAIGELHTLMRPIVEGMEYGRFSETGKTLTNYCGNIRYLQWIMEQMGAQYDVREGNKLDNLYLRSFGITKGLKDASRLAKECRQKYLDAIEVYGKDAFEESEDRNAMSDCRKVLQSKFDLSDMTEEFNKAKKVQPSYEILLRNLSDMLYLEESVFSRSNKNIPTPISKGKNATKQKYNAQHKQRKRVRAALEAYRLIGFINSEYKATMGSKLGGESELMKTVLDQFTRNAHF